MKIIAVASHNPVKIAAAQAGFQRMFPNETWIMQSIAAPSGVPDQPFSSAETLQGARNRAANARVLLPSADFWVGIEGGVAPEEQVPWNGATSTDSSSEHAHLAAFAWVVILSTRQRGEARTGTFFLPPAVAELVHAGKELGEADDMVFGRVHSKRANGAVGLLTGDVLNRAGFYEQAILLALIPFRNPQLYPV